MEQTVLKTEIGTCVNCLEKKKCILLKNTDILWCWECLMEELDYD